MKALMTITLALFVTSAYGQSNIWKGLQPLHSTVADVERTLGKPTKNIYPGAFIYGPDTARGITINYAQKTCDEGWSVPTDTVLSIEVPAGIDVGKSADDLKLDEKLFFRQTDDAIFGTWTNLDSGVAYYFSGYNRALISVRYVPRQIDNVLRCDGFPPYVAETLYYYSEIASFHDPKLSQKEDIATEKARIDNFALSINYQFPKDYQGYILIYFDDQLPIEEYRRRISNAKIWFRKRSPTYLDRITFIEGGFKEKNEMCFYILPKDKNPPVPNPTLASPQFAKKPKQ